jgi:hypothetical protein
MDAWNRKVTKDLPALLESLHDFADVDDVAYILEGVRLGLERLRLKSERLAKKRDGEVDETVEVGHKVLGRAEKRLNDLINRWAPSWKTDGEH